MAGGQGGESEAWLAAGEGCRGLDKRRSMAEST